MSDAQVSFLPHALAEMSMGGTGWQRVKIRSAEHRGTLLRLTLVTGAAWNAGHNSIRTDDERLEHMRREALRRAIAASVTGTLRRIADMTEALVKGEDPNDAR